MDPISLALAGGSLVNSVIQGNAAHNLNRAIAARNLASQETAAFNQNMLANRMLQQQEAGSTDARGNVTRYIPGVGWVTTPSEMTRRLTGASDQEELNRLTVDAALRRRGMQANEARRGDEGAYADETLAELRQPDQYDENRIFNVLRQRNREGLARGFDDESRSAGRQALRSRSSNAGNIFAALAERRGEAYRRADAGAKADAIGMSESLKGQRDARLGNKYNMFASRASNFDDTQFAPNALGGQLAAVLASRQNTAPQAYGMAINAAGAAPQMQPVKPNFTNSFALGGLADLLGAMNENNSSKSDSRSQAKALFDSGAF